MFALICEPAYAKTVANPIPAEPPVRVVLQEIWRSGGDDGVVLGAPVGVTTDDEGNVILCDHQLASLFAVGPGADKIGVLARSGEGPGELGMPVALDRLPDGGYGVAEFFPGRITRITANGEPGGSVLVDPTPDREGGFTLLTSLAVGGENVVVSGFNQAPRNEGIVRSDFLASIDRNGVLDTWYIELSTSMDPNARTVRERGLPRAASSGLRCGTRWALAGGP